MQFSQTQHIRMMKATATKTLKMYIMAFTLSSVEWVGTCLRSHFLPSTRSSGFTMRMLVPSQTRDVSTK